MAGAVHVEFFVTLAFQHGIHAAVAQLEVDETLRQYAQRGIVRGVPGLFRHCGGDRGGLRGQHDLVHILLRGAEFAVDREGARDVGGVAVQLAARVDQQQIAVLEFGVVSHIVQHAGICAARDDGGVRGMARAVAAEFMQQLGFDLILELIGTGELHRALVRARGYRCGAAHDVQFVFIFEQAHLIEQRAHVANFVGSADAAADFFLYCAAQLEEALIPCRIATQGIKKRGLVAHQFRQFFVQLLDRISRVETELFLCGIGTKTVAIPDLAFQILFAAEQDGLWFISSNQHQHRFRLNEAAQVIKVAVVAVAIMRVGIARHFRRGGDDGDAALHLRQQTGAALGIDGRVCSHDALCSERTCVSSSARRCGVPTSTHKPWWCSPLILPRAICARSNGASGAMLPRGIPANKPG